jgi:nucleotide-binding universal stress UspA family protein
VVAKVGDKLRKQPAAVTINAITGLAGAELITASQHADTLVIGSRGMRDFRALRVSEMAAKVTHYASCPVVIVPPAH